MRADTLFLACTRPAVVPGIEVPAPALGVIMILCGEFFVISAHFLGPYSRMIWSAILTLAALGGCRAAVRYDPNIFRLVYLWSVTSGKASGTWATWRGCSFSPVPTARVRTAAGITYVP